MGEPIKITPQTYIDINKELEEDGCVLRFNVPTQEAIDKWRSVSYYPDDVYKDGGGPSVWDPEWDRIREERYKSGELE